MSGNDVDAIGKRDCSPVRARDASEVVNEHMAQQLAAMPDVIEADLEAASCVSSVTNLNYHHPPPAGPLFPSVSQLVTATDPTVNNEDGAEQPLSLSDRPKEEPCLVEGSEDLSLEKLVAARMLEGSDEDCKDEEEQEKDEKTTAEPCASKESDALVNVAISTIKVAASAPSALDKGKKESSEAIGSMDPVINDIKSAMKDFERMSADAPPPLEKSDGKEQEKGDNKSLEDVAAPAPAIANDGASEVQPGAYALAPRGVTHTPPPNSAPVNEESGSSTSSGGPSAISARSRSNDDVEEGMPIANEVSPDDNSSLPMAEQYANPERRRTKERKDLYLKAAVFSMLALAAVVALGLGIGLGVKGGGGSSSTPAPQDADATNVPTAEHVPEEVTLLQGLVPASTLQSIMDDPYSAQAQAYEWMLEDLYLNPGRDEQRTIQRFFLATLYYATKGDFWHNNEGWLNHTLHECSWFSKPGFGVENMDTITYVTHDYPNPCQWPSTNVPRWEEEMLPQPYQHVWLYENNLHGSVPPEIHLLAPTIRSLSIYNNEVTGPIPTQVGLLSHLIAVNAGGTTLSGGIPSELGMLSSEMFSLAIINSGLQGTVPSEIGQMTALNHFLLEGNHLTGSIPSQVAHLTNLRYFYLDQNMMTGTIPSSIGGWTHLNQLMMDQNSWSGTLPTEVGLLEDLIVMALYVNELSGPIPSELGMLSVIELLYLDGNHFTGTIPTELGPKWETMFYLEFADNELIGTLPSELALCPNLKKLTAGKNTLTGTIPAAIAQLPFLQRIHLEANQLTGSIPNVDYPEPFRKLVLNDNFLTGPIPLDLVNSTGLSNLSLQNNHLSGSIPLEFSLLEKLEVFNISNNEDLWGFIPSGLCVVEGLALSFDCSTELCGCDCRCLRFQNGTVSNNTIL